MIEIKYCKDCRRYFDSDSYQCTSCNRSNTETQSLMQILNWLNGEINYLHQEKANKPTTYASGNIEVKEC